MRLGRLELENPFVQAPLAGVTDAAFRTISRRFHSGLLYTEMVSAEGLCRGSWRTMKFVEIPKEHRPVALQIAGHEPERLAEAAELADTLDIDIIDINAGCPQLKITKPGSGGALLKNPGKLASIVEAVVSRTSTPVSVKMRLGWARDESLAIGKLVQESGAAFITIHGRTVAQKFGGENDWQAIRRLAGELDVPVLANGDARTEEDAVRLLERTGAAGVMIGRATRGRPDIIGTAHSQLAHGSHGRMDGKTLAKTILDHAALEQELFGAEGGIKRMRKHVNWYLKAAGLEHPAREIYSMCTIEALEGILRTSIPENDL